MAQGLCPRLGRRGPVSPRRSVARLRRQGAMNVTVLGSAPGHRARGACGRRPDPSVAPPEQACPAAIGTAHAATCPRVRLRALHRAHLGPACAGAGRRHRDADEPCLPPPSPPASTAVLCPAGLPGPPSPRHEVARGFASTRVGRPLRPRFAIEVAAQPRRSSLPQQRGCAPALRAFTTPSGASTPRPIVASSRRARQNVLAIATASPTAWPRPERPAALVTAVARDERPASRSRRRATSWGVGPCDLVYHTRPARNRTVGVELARGKALADILAELGHVAEGVRSAPMVLARAAASGVEMPIVAAVAEVLGGKIGPEDALQQLMRREARSESFDAAQVDPA